MPKNKIVRRILVIAAPFAAAALFVLISYIVLKYVPMPACLFNVVTGFYCPGCGTTRAVAALLHGDVLLSLRQNPLVIAAIIYSALLYAEPVAKAFGKTDFRSPVRNLKVTCVIIAVLLVYLSVRNLVPAIAPVPLT